jgi:hypothetical protein
MFNTIFLYSKITVIVCLYTWPNIFLRDEFKADEIGGLCGTHGEERTHMEGFGGKARSKEKVWKTSR